MTPTTERKRLGDLFVFKNGRAFKKQEWSTNGLPIIRIQNLNSKDAPFNYFGGEYSTDILIERDDLLFSWSGTVGSSFGSHLWSGETAVLNQHIFKVAPCEAISKRYAFYALRYITEEIEQSVNGAVGLVHITKEKLNEFTLPVPLLPEQQRIVSILDEAFNGIATAKSNAEKNLENARALFESHLHSVFTHQGPGWMERTLGEVAERVSTGPFGTMLHKSDYVPDGIPLVNPMNIVNSRIVPSSKMMVSEETRQRLRTYVLRTGDVVIGRRGELGRCALITDRENGWLCGTGSFFVRLSDRMDAKFFVALFGSQQFRSRLEGSAVGTTMSSLNHGILNDLRLPVPPVAVQRQEMVKADHLLSEMQCLESVYRRKLIALESLKKSLLHQAFTGQL